MFTLFALAIGGKDILILALSGVAGAAGVAFLTKKDTEVEGRRRGAAEIASELDKVGLSHSASFFRSYAVGDYSGMWKDAHSIVSILKTPETRAAVLRTVVENHLKNIRENPDEVAAVLKALGQEAKKPTA